MPKRKRTIEEPVPSTDIETDSERDALGRIKDRRWTAFGETKNVKQWGEDPRCSVAWGTLYSRLVHGKMPVEQAITQPLPNPELYEAFGKRRTIYEWSKDPRCKVTYSCLCDRVKDGVPFREALTKAGKLVRRKRVYPMYSAFGESKTLREWSQDRRCFASLGLLHKRLKRGIPLETAMSFGGLLTSTPKCHEAFGERKTLYEWVRDPRCRCSYGTLTARLGAGMPFALALVDTSSSVGDKRSVKVEAFGETKSVGDWAKDPRCIVSLQNLRSRMRKGLSMEQAMTQPLDKLMTLTGFGETRLVSQWLSDPRAVITRGTLENRLARGESFESALTRPNHQNYRKPNSYQLTMYNETKSLNAWASDPRCEVSESEFRKRVRQGATPEDALRARDKYVGHTRYSAFGESKILEEWAKDPRCVVPRGTLRQRLFNGEPCESAMTRPPFGRLAAIWDIERFRGGSYEALEIEANRFRVEEVTPEETAKRTMAPRSRKRATPKK